MMKKKRLLAWSSGIIFFLLYCLYTVWTINLQVSEAEAQCIYYSLCRNTGCCAGAGGTTISNVRVARGDRIELCYH